MDVSRSDSEKMDKKGNIASLPAPQCSLTSYIGVLSTVALAADYLILSGRWLVVVLKCTSRKLPGQRQIRLLMMPSASIYSVPMQDQ